MIHMSDKAASDGVWVGGQTCAEEDSALKSTKWTSRVFDKHESRDRSAFGEPHQTIKWSLCLYEIY